MKPILISAFLLLLFATPTLAGPDDPVKLSDINAMHKRGLPVEQMLIAMSDRGVGFRMTASAERRLDSWGFTQEDIGHVRGIIAGKKYTPQAEREPAEDGANNGAPADAGDRFPLGHAHDEEDTAGIDLRLKRAIKAAQLGYQVHALGRVTLMCSDRRADELLDSLKKIEKELIAELPPSLSSATGPKTTLLVVADNQRDAHKFDEMLVASYRVDWPGFEKGQRSGGDWAYRMRANASVIDGSPYKEPEDLGRLMAFAMGYMIAEQIADNYSPIALSAGLGDLVEQMAYGNPSFVFGQDSGQHKDKIEDWGAFIRERAGRKRLPALRNVLAYPYDKMRDEQYAEAWSMVSYLRTKPRRLYELLYGLRSATGKPIQTLLKVYDVDERELQLGWLKHIADSR